MFSPNAELIHTPEAARILGISNRELDYWKQFNLGPSPIQIIDFYGNKTTYFIKQEIVNLSKDIKEFAQIKKQIRYKFKEFREQRKLKFD